MLPSDKFKHKRDFSSVLRKDRGPRQDMPLFYYRLFSLSLLFCMRHAQLVCWSNEHFFVFNEVLLDLLLSLQVRNDRFVCYYCIFICTHQRNTSYIVSSKNSSFVASSNDLCTSVSAITRSEMLWEKAWNFWVFFNGFPYQHIIDLESPFFLTWQLILFAKTVRQFCGPLFGLSSGPVLCCGLLIRIRGRAYLKTLCMASTAITNGVFNVIFT